MLIEPLVKRALVSIDGQNLFHAAKEAFGYSYPNYDVALAANHCYGAIPWASPRS